jgi:glycosyltransferase involved in cell wall biosynthesis
VNDVLVNHRYHPFPGGSENYIKSVAEWLQSAGVATRVITTNAWDLEYFWDRHSATVADPAQESLGGVEVRRLEVRQPPLGCVSFPVLRRAMGETSRVVPFEVPFRVAARWMPRVPGLRQAILDGPQPDAIIATNLSLEGPAIAAQSASRRSGAHLVVFPFAHLGSDDEGKALRYISMPHQRSLLSSASLVLTMTDREAGFVERAGADAHRIATVGAGISMDEVTGGCPERIGTLIGERLPIVAAIGALAPDKGTCDLVAASDILRRQGVPVNLVLIGPELSSFTRWLRSCGADSWPWIHRLGVVDDGMKRNLLAAMDVLVLPSRTESFGIVYLEAWANRKPVVAARVGAVPEIVTHGEDGLLVPFGDVSAIAGAIRQLIECPEARARLGDAGHRKVERMYAWERVHRRIGKAFARVLGLDIIGDGKA